MSSQSSSPAFNTQQQNLSSATETANRAHPAKTSLQGSSNPTSVQAFGGASNVTLNGHASIQIVGGDSTMYAVPDSGMEILKNGIVPGMLYDSGRVLCHPGTRGLVREIISQWLNDSTGNACPVLWLCGAAGSGKSAIMQTMTKTCVDNGTLAAACFLSQDADAKSMLPTIAYQLATNIAPLKSLISNAVTSNPNILTSSISSQFSQLIHKPIIDACLISGEPIQHIISVDGLDEYCDTAEQTKFIEVLLIEAEKQSLPFRFIIASRAESHFETPFRNYIARRVVHSVRLDEHGSFHPDRDIELYLRDEFKEILGRQPDVVKNELPLQWPSEDQIKSLVSNASGQFIYASTVVKFVGEPGFHPDSQLDLVFKPIDSKPLSKLDELYLKLCKAHKNHEKLLRILKVFIHLPGIPPIPTTAHTVTVCSPISNLELTTPIIDDIFGLKTGETAAIVLHIRSLFKVVDNVIHLQHASFKDFLESPKCSGMFYVGPDRTEVVKWWYLSIIRPRCGPVSSSREIHMEFLRRKIFIKLQSSTEMFTSLEHTSIRGSTFLSFGGGDHVLFQKANAISSRGVTYTWIGTRAGTFNNLTRDFHAPTRSSEIFFTQATRCSFRGDTFNFFDLTKPEEAYLADPPSFRVFSDSHDMSFKGVTMNMHHGFGGSFHVSLADDCIIRGSTYNDIYQWPQILSNEEQTALTQSEKMFPIPDWQDSPVAACDKETHEDIFTMLMRWMKIFDPLSAILLFYGPSRGGKTALVRRITQACMGDSLAASCFIPRDNNPQNSARQLFPVLAHQIAKTVPALASGIARAFLSGSEILTQGSLEDLFKEFIMKPVRDARVPLALRNRNICITGLDQLSRSDAHLILQIISQYSINRQLPFRFLISYSLPLSNLTHLLPFRVLPYPFYMSKLSANDLPAMLSDKINCAATLFLKGSSRHLYNAKFYLWTGLDKIRRKRPGEFHALSLWPSEPAVDALVAWSSGSLVFATHVLRFVGADDKKPKDQLNKVVGMVTLAPPPTDLSHILDELFTRILTSHPRHDMIISIFKLLNYLPGYTFISRHCLTLPIVEGILLMCEGEAADLMRSLSSIVYLHDNNSRVGLYDKTFMDFLEDRTRSGKLSINEANSAEDIKKWCLEAFLNWSPKQDNLQKAHLIHVRRHILEGYKQAFRPNPEENIFYSL